MKEDEIQQMISDADSTNTLTASDGKVSFEEFTELMRSKKAYVSSYLWHSFREHNKLSKGVKSVMEKLDERNSKKLLKKKEAASVAGSVRSEEVLPLTVFTNTNKKPVVTAGPPLGKFEPPNVLPIELQRKEAIMSASFGCMLLSLIASFRRFGKRV